MERMEGYQTDIAIRISHEREWTFKDIFNTMAQEPLPEDVQAFTAYIDNVDAEKLVGDLTRYCWDTKQRPDEFIPLIVRNIEKYLPDRPLIASRVKTASQTVISAVTTFVANREIANLKERGESLEAALASDLDSSMLPNKRVWIGIAVTALLGLASWSVWALIKESEKVSA